MESLGRIEIYFNAYIVVQVVRALCQNVSKPLAEFVTKYSKLKAMYDFAKDINKLHGNLLASTYTKEVYKKY